MTYKTEEVMLFLWESEVRKLVSLSGLGHSVKRNKSDNFIQSPLWLVKWRMSMFVSQTFCIDALPS